MRVIVLDASAWRSPDDFYSALLPELGAPDWHGRNLDALDDGLYGEINEVNPPLEVNVSNANALSDEMLAFLANVSIIFADARADRGED